MSSQRVTVTDLRRAFEAHRDALAKCGIVYDGRLILSEGSKLYGNAYRINLTDCDHHCQQTKSVTAAGVSVFGWHEDEHGNPATRVRMWDHADCPACHGSGREICSGHFNPPIGDDYLGMTAREAYDELTSRTRTIYDTAAALDKASVSR